MNTALYILLIFSQIYLVVSICYMASVISNLAETSPFLPNNYEKKKNYFIVSSAIGTFFMVLVGIDRLLDFIPEKWGFHFGENGTWLGVKELIALIIAMFLATVASKVYKWLVISAEKIKSFNDKITAIKNEIQTYLSLDPSEYLTGTLDKYSLEILNEEGDEISLAFLKKQNELFAEIIENCASKILNVQDDWQAGILRSEFYIAEVKKQALRMLRATREFNI